MGIDQGEDACLIIVLSAIFMVTVILARFFHFIPV